MKRQVNQRRAAPQVTTEEQRDGFRTQLNEAEDWLYMDPEAEKGTAETFQAKLAALRGVGDPVQGRMREAAERDDRVGDAKLLVDLVKKAVNSWPDAKPWMNATFIEALAQKVRLPLPTIRLVTADSSRPPRVSVRMFCAYASASGRVQRGGGCVCSLGSSKSGSRTP